MRRALDPIDRVLLPRADIATEALLARLTSLGWEAEDVTAYRTVRAAPPPAPIREAIKGGGFDAEDILSDLFGGLGGRGRGNKQPRKGESSNQANQGTDQRQPHALKHNHAAYTPFFRAECHSNSNLLSPLLHRVSHQPINSDRSQQQSRAGKDRQQQHIEVRACGRPDNNFIHWTDICDRKSAARVTQCF